MSSSLWAFIYFISIENTTLFINLQRLTHAGTNSSTRHRGYQKNKNDIVAEWGWLWVLKNCCCFWLTGVGSSSSARAVSMLYIGCHVKFTAAAVGRRYKWFTLYDISHNFVSNEWLRYSIIELSDELFFLCENNMPLIEQLVWPKNEGLSDSKKASRNTRVDIFTPSWSSVES